MLAMDFVKANRDTVERAIRDKGVELDLDTLLTLDAEVRGLKTEIEKLRAERNAVSAKFKDATPEEKAELGRQAKEAGARASALENDLVGKEDELGALMLKLPGIPYAGAPVGPDETYNQVIRTEGDPPKFGFEPLDHVALIERNGWGDLSRVTQVSGSRTYCLKGRLALLETKLMAWALERIAAANFTPITVPAIAREQAFLNRASFPAIARRLTSFRMTICGSPAPRRSCSPRCIRAKSSKPTSCRSSTRATRPASAARREARARTCAGSCGSISS